MTIRVKENESFESAYKRFKRWVEKKGVMAESKSREHYQKPSEIRKRAKLAAVKREQKRKSREKQYEARDRLRYSKSNVAPLVYLDTNQDNSPTARED